MPGTPILQGTTQDAAFVRIEGLRGLAACLVMATHYLPLMGWQPGVWNLASTGVNLFFVLSGYVFAPYLLRSGFAVVPHLVRRFFRLYPLYLAALLAYALLKPAGQQWTAWWPHIFMLHTTSTLQVAAHYNAAFWSLPPEVEFYLALPILAWWVRRGGFISLLLVALGLNAVLAGLAHHGESPESLRAIATVHLPGILLQFLMGAAVALAPAWTATRRARGVLAGLGVLAGVLLCALWQAHRQADGQVSLPPTVAAWVGTWAALVYALALRAILPALDGPAESRKSAETPVAMRPHQRWAVAIGSLSYGLYLLHNAAPQALQRWWPELQGVALVGSSVALTLVSAFLAHRFIESPLREWGRRWSARLMP